MHGFLLQVVIFCVGFGEYRPWVLDRSLMKWTIGDVVRNLVAQGDLQYG